MLPIVRTFDLHNSFDIVQARQCARELARDIGFGLTDQTRFATAVSELARCALDDDGDGSVRFAVLSNGLRQGLECTCLGSSQFEDQLQPGRGGILGGVERLVDEFEFERRDGKGVAVVMRKWLRQEAPDNDRGAFVHKTSLATV